MQVRVCPECREEYRPEIVVCADCGAELVDSDDEAPAAMVLPPAAPDPEPTELEEGETIVYASNRVHDLAPLADELVRAGLPFRIVPKTDPARHQTHYRLAVPAEALGVAQPLLAAVVERHPELSLHDLAPVTTDEAQWQAEMDAVRSRSACPACGAQFSPGALECPGCGLVFGGGDEDAE